MKYLTLSALSLSLLVSQAQAAPWVDTSDIYLRADIQTLADAGVITVPVNTFPLMWAGIGLDLGKAEPSLMHPDVASAFARVNYYYRQAVDNTGNTRIKGTAATDAARFQHYGSDYREQGELKVSHEYMDNRFAFKLSATAAYDAQDDKDFRLDDSWASMVLGNWVMTAGAVEQWWGPGFDTSMHRTNNARPMPSVMLSRNDAHGFETPWLSWIGPWNLTMGLSWMNDERAVKDTLLWNFRGSLRPIQQVEIGASWTAQMCGEGQACDLSTVFKALSGSKDCSNDVGFGCTAYGNQQAGWDIRYGDTWFDIPVGIYLQRTCEDSNGAMPWNLADCAKMAGVDTRISFREQQYKLFLEYTDTLVACGVDDNAFNCFYEHSTYTSGMRYYRRSLGSTYDSDAETWVLGMIGQFSDSKGMSAFLRYAQLNKDGKNRGGEWVPQTAKEDLLMLEVSYRQPMFRGMVTMGGTLSKSEYETDSSNDASLYASYEYRF
ncbi:capsule assembly Wzi family protein [Shewanella sp.]|uniref:capsule assembly Wzi family protein n=1 Tax=Shewanella sp. TaxID=50422 RepID=UPI003563DF53